jgi:hypothetical protein
MMAWRNCETGKLGDSAQISSTIQWAIGPICWASSRRQCSISLGLGGKASGVLVLAAAGEPEECEPEEYEPEEYEPAGFAS